MEEFDITQLYHFLFETIPGVGVLVGIGIVVSIIVSVIFEVRTRKRYHNHEVSDDDAWSIFDDDDDEEESGEN